MKQKNKKTTDTMDERQRRRQPTFLISWHAKEKKGNHGSRLTPGEAKEKQERKAAEKERKRYQAIKLASNTMAAQQAAPNQNQVAAQVQEAGKSLPKFKPGQDIMPIIANIR